MEPLKPPVQIGEVTEEELKDYDGNNPEKPLLMAIKGQIYDVSQSRYGFKWKKKLDFFFCPFCFL
jgi:membrane-associated progesterone receptor component